MTSPEVALRQLRRGMRISGRHIRPILLGCTCAPCRGGRKQSCSFETSSEYSRWDRSSPPLCCRRVQVQRGSLKIVPVWMVKAGRLSFLLELLGLLKLPRSTTAAHHFCTCGHLTEALGGALPLWQLHCGKFGLPPSYSRVQCGPQAPSSWLSGVFDMIGRRLWCGWTSCVQPRPFLFSIANTAFLNRLNTFCDIPEMIWR